MNTPRPSLILLCLLFGTIALPQASAQNGPTDTPILQALRISPGDEINMDGILDEAAWELATPAREFTQSDPDFGAVATERTILKIIYDESNLYIGAELLDSEPDGVLYNQMVRDGFLSGDDRFMWTLDPLFDQRSGYFFEINPAGAMGDAQLVPNRVETTQNRAWDGIWLARVTRHEGGWTAEIQIPFQTLNFNPDAPAWGANFQRTVRRKNEESFWTGFGRNQGLFNLSSAGRIEGIENVSQGKGLDVTPYTIGTYRRQGSGPEAASNYTGDAGLDLAYSLTPRLKLNATFNTDFAQTEVDDRQVNLTRFALFFPEKRDFFLEGTGGFDFGRERAQILTPFFTRRIGLTADGQPQKIDYGLKLTGQALGLDLGVMQVRTASDAGALGEDFTAIRPKKTFWSQSYVGMFYTRRATRESSIPDRHSIGADFQLGTTTFRGDKNLLVSGYFIKTPNEARGDDNTAWSARVEYPNDRWNVQVAYRVFEQNFVPAMGFTERTNYKKWYNNTQFRPRPENSQWFRQFNFGARNEFFMDLEGNLGDWLMAITAFEVDFHSGDNFSIQVEPRHEELTRDFRLSEGITLPNGNQYDFTRYTVNFSTANRRPIAVSMSVGGGSFFSGDRRDLEVGLSLRPRPGFLAELSANFSRVELPEGNFSTKILRAVVNTQFSPWVSVSNNVQFDSVSGVLGWQSRFRGILNPGNDIFFVWLNNWIDTGTELETLDRSATAKVLYTYRF